MNDADHQQLAAHWQRAQQLLDARDLLAAMDELEAIIALDRLQSAAWLMLANLARGAHRCRSAIEYARNAAAAVHESRDWRPLADVALMLQSLGESSLAAKLVLTAERDHPAVIAAADRLAQCLGLVDLHAEALTLLDRALARVAVNPALSFMRATTLRHLGRRAEATAEYRRCLELAPHYAAAMLMLAQHDRKVDAAAQLARIDAALTQADDRDSPDAVMLHYARFILLDDVDGTTGAWQALMRGAAIKRRSVNWQPARDEERLAAVREVCRGEFLQPVPTEGATRVPIFIVGQPRTGTTVLERILGNHSEVASAGELNDFHLQLCWQADALVEHVDPALIRACVEMDFGAVGRGYRQRTSWRSPDKRFLIDKLPVNVWYAGLIHKALPEARVICMLRDPMDTCMSTLKELFAGSSYPWSYDPLEAAEHHLLFRQLLAHWDEQMPGAVLSVRYEDLVRDPESVARRVMEHCGLPFEPGCVDLLRNAAPSATASSSQVREPLHARGIGAWRRYAEPLAEARAWLEARLPAQAFSAD